MKIQHKLFALFAALWHRHKAGPWLLLFRFRCLQCLCLSTRENGLVRCFWFARWLVVHSGLVFCFSWFFDEFIGLLMHSGFAFFHLFRFFLAQALAFASESASGARSSLRKFSLEWGYPEGERWEVFWSNRTKNLFFLLFCCCFYPRIWF